MKNRGGQFQEITDSNRPSLEIPRFLYFFAISETDCLKLQEKLRHGASTAAHELCVIHVCSKNLVTSVLL